MTQHDDPVAEFLRAVEAGDVASCTAWADDVALDATVPNWRFEVAGRDAVAAEYSRWFAGPGRFTLATDTAPWSDDPSWHVTLSLHRDDYIGGAAEGEKFLFENLPAPGSAPIEVTREVTLNGITLRLSNITAMQKGEARFTIGGWAEKDPLHRVIVVHDARDDQGRTHATLLPGQTTRLVAGPVGGTAEGPVFAVRLPEGAKGWNLTLLAESVTTVKFNPRAPLPR